MNRALGALINGHYNSISSLQTILYRLPPWFPWLSSRLLSGLGVVVVISFIVFGATQALPSDPARIILGPEASEQAITILRQQLGLDKPIYIQYIHWVGEVLSGNLGRSLDSNVEIINIISGRFSNTIALTLTVSLVAIPLAIIAGVLLALNRDKAIDRVTISTLILFKAVPGFVLAIWLVMLFSTSVFTILPAASLLDPGRHALYQIEYLILPTLTLILSVIPYLLRLVRASMIEAMESDYVVSARLRGIAEHKIIWQHALPNALIPTIQGVAMTFRFLFSGVVLIEVVFSYPGIGNTLNAAIETRDIPMIQAIVLVVTLSVVIINLAADFVTLLLTPKLRMQRANRAASNPVINSNGSTLNSTDNTTVTNKTSHLKAQ
jgi:peptide/nickel transport system permease protein